MRYEFDSQVVRWDSREDSWFFAHVPLAESEEIRALPLPRAGFGSLKVRVSLGGSTWVTSIFPARDGRYALPLKRAVREREGVEDGDTVHVVVELVEP